jgi:hypothetical protein
VLSFSKIFVLFTDPENSDLKGVENLPYFNNSKYDLGLSFRQTRLKK